MVDFLLLLLLFSLLNNVTWWSEIVKKAYHVLVVQLQLQSRILFAARNDDGDGCCWEEEDSCSMSMTDDDNNTLESSDESYNTPVCAPQQNQQSDSLLSSSLRSTTTKSSSYENRRTRRRVRFHNVCIRNYNVIPIITTSSTNASLSSTATSSSPNIKQQRGFSWADSYHALIQPPPRTVLTLDWTYSKQRELSVELFERMRCVTYPRKSHTRQKLSSSSSSSFGKPLSLGMVSPQLQALQAQLEDL